MAKKEFEGICPCCEKQMTVTEYRCKKCGIAVSGDFKKSDFWNLDQLQLKFAEIFLKNRGNIKDVEKELGVSYPSVKKMLDNLVSALTNGKNKEQQSVPKVVFSHKGGLSVMNFEEGAESVGEESAVGEKDTVVEEFTAGKEFSAGKEFAAEKESSKENDSEKDI